MCIIDALEKEPTNDLVDTPTSLDAIWSGWRLDIYIGFGCVIFWMIKKKKKKKKRNEKKEIISILCSHFLNNYCCQKKK